MRCYHPDFQKHNLGRPPTWRIDRAVQLIESGSRPDARRDDDLTLLAAAYLRAPDPAAGPDGRSGCLLRPYDALHAAHRVHDAGGELRWELEARLLAGQTSRGIADATGLDAAVIDAYEAYFYCVRDRLDASDWVAWKAVGALDTLASIWKAVAYNGGPLALEAVMACTSARPRETRFPADLLRKASRLVSAFMAPAEEILAKALPTPKAKATPRGQRPLDAAAIFDEVIALAGNTTGRTTAGPDPRPQPHLGRTPERGATRAAA